ncbi:MAG: hypothetical protein IKA56_02305 [Clostridia bacterium]|nr:hypothetical protein [Clostridia bacterium]
MIVDINKILDYGRYYEESEYIYPIRWWFCLIDYEVYETEELFDKYSFATIEEIKNNDNYIELFKTNITMLKKEFILKYEYTDKTLINIMKQRNCNYDVAFRIYIEVDRTLTELWREYRHNRLYGDAIKWCKENCIRYKN